MGGEFSRTDRNNNRIASIRADRFAAYLQAGQTTFDPHVDVFRRFNEVFLTGQVSYALPTVQAMHVDNWPDTFQGEWPGFYLEYRLSAFLSAHGLTDQVRYVKEKRRGLFDYDLELLSEGNVAYYGDLKASDYLKHESPGNDAASIAACVNQYGKFWYVIYEHETHKAKDHGDVATIEWNEWKRSVGYTNRKEYNPLSYRTRFKAAVRFFKMRILEVNPANFGIVLGDFAQGSQPDGAGRALKVMINKRNVENFLVYEYDVDRALMS
ncbi:hypothetical protein [Georgenia yuyongxinii]